MRRAKRTELTGEAKRLNRERLARIGAELRVSRKRRRARQADVGHRAGLSRSAAGSIEPGYGGTFSADSLQAVSMAVGRRLEFQLSSDSQAEPADAGHLAIQELVLRLGRAAGFARTFELPTRPADPARSADVGLRDDRRRLLVLVECWNTIGDVGAAARSSKRKRAEAEALEVFGTRFSGSSAGWVGALLAGGESPSEPGLVWCDLAATRVFAWRRQS